jgi:HEAT repeat protein
MEEWMTNTKQLIEYAQHPELALQNLAELLALLESNDETIQNYSSEALENCGPPRPEDVPFLCQQLKSRKSSYVYWASTLLGRIGSGKLSTTEVKDLQASLTTAIADASLELSARERAAWAICELGQEVSSNRDPLEKELQIAAPRLKRFIESALALGQKK